MTLAFMRLAGAVTGSVIYAVTTTADAQSYPSRPVRIIASEAGGGNDFVIRQITPSLAPVLGQPVIVDNRGLNGNEIVQHAPADGYTLLVVGSGLWLLPYLRKAVSYDPIRDFAPISLLVSSPGVLVVHPSVPVNSVKELIAAAKAKPGQLNYAAGAVGALPFMAAELFKYMTKVDMVFVPFKGNGPAINSLLANEVQIMFATTGASMPHIKSGRMKPLAVTSVQRSALFPELPTVNAAVPGFEAAAMTALFAPAKTPATVVARLNQEIVRVLHQPEVRDRYLVAGIEVVASTLDDLARKIKSEMSRLGTVIRAAGIHDD